MRIPWLNTGTLANIKPPAKPHNAKCHSVAERRYAQATRLTHLRMRLHLIGNAIHRFVSLSLVLLAPIAMAAEDTQGSSIKIPVGPPPWCQFEHDATPTASNRVVPTVRPEWHTQGGTIHAKAYILVDEEGTVENIAIWPDELDERIVKAIWKSVDQWSIKPAMWEGKRVPSCLLQPYRFTFKEPLQPPHSIGNSENPGP